MLRKLISILLLVVFSFPLVSTLFALQGDADASVPVCCRKNGKHHCMMNIAERANSAQTETQFSAPVERCPYCPRAITAAHIDVMTPSMSASIFSSLVSHPTGTAQTETKWRIAHDRSRQKRGPPSLLG